MTRSLPALGAAALGFVFSALAANDASAFQVTPYGSGVNPPGSLVVTSGIPTVGQSFTLGVSNTATASWPASFAFVSIATAPDPAFPAGTVLPGFGLSAPGAQGELLISLFAPNPLVTLGPVPWAGGVTPPADFTLSVPFAPALTGLTLYFQGSLLQPVGIPSLGVTNGLAVTLSAPSFPGLVLIQPGTFQMGSNAANGAPYFNGLAEKPVHQVTISKPFWMGRYEVTQAEYQAVVGTNPSYFFGPNKPVENVTWFDAMAYCAALTAQYAPLGAVPTGYEFRLPTEAEWEWACRAGALGAALEEFNTGPSLVCNNARFRYSYHSNSECSGWQSATVPVGSYAPNAWGLYDMHGNVWEWCMDSFSSYTASAKTDPYVSGETGKVLRGGSWYFYSNFCRSAYRSYSIPGDSDDDVGFRVVLAPVLVP